ncbi:MAG TPA: luciferase family protein [Candidatus Bathyarchaeia archaeon]|nr:luciferase family protein [Candidatus Bathyarchaeia archaeon]
MSFTDMVTGEMMLLPGVERAEHGGEDVELRVGGKTFAHIHGVDRIDVRLPSDLKETLIQQGAVSRSPETHDREGWVILKLGNRPNLGLVIRILQAAYKHISSTL